MAFIDDLRKKERLISQRAYAAHDEQRAKLFEIYELIEKLVGDDKGERIVELYRHLDKIIQDYNSRGNSTHLPLINLFKLLIEKRVKGYKLLNAINNFPSAVFFADAVCRDENWAIIIAQSPEELQQAAKKSLQKCLDII